VQTVESRLFQLNLGHAQRGIVETTVLAEKELVSKNQSRFLPYLAVPSVENVRTWRFVPEKRATFIVKYMYRIEGEETLVPENPRVELDLPSLVTVIAKPFKPTCSGCVL
jgi:hypothetical protein